MTTVTIKEINKIEINNVDEKTNIKMSSVGEVTGLDGRYYRIDGEALLKTLQENALDIPLNENHCRPYGSKESHRSIGWFSDFSLVKSGKNKGIYANLELNDSGKTIVKKRYHRYLSPEYIVNYDDRKVELIAAIGLVSEPNIPGQSLNNRQPEATDQQTVRANNNSPQPSTQENHMKEKETLTQEINDLQVQNQKVKEENQTLKQESEKLQKELNKTKIDSAITAGKLLPAKQAFAETLEANALDMYLKTEAESTQAKEDSKLAPEKTKEDNAFESNPLYKQIVGE